jgi:hypothetical protein
MFVRERSETPMRPYAFLLAPLLVAATTPSAEAQTRVEGVFAEVKIDRQGRWLILADGDRFSIPTAVWNGHRREIDALRKGDKIEFTHDARRRVLTFGKDQPTVRVGRVRSADTFHSLRQDGARTWLLLGSGQQFEVHPEVLRQTLIHTLERDDPIELWTEKGIVAEVQRRDISRKVTEQVQETLKWTRRTDVVSIQLKTENRGQLYRVKQVQSSRIVLYPRIPRSNPPEFTSKGVVTFNMDQIDTLDNPAADERRRAAGGGAVIGGWVLGRRGGGPAQQGAEDPPGRRAPLGRDHRPRRRPPGDAGEPLAH